MRVKFNPAILEMNGIMENLVFSKNSSGAICFPKPDYTIKRNIFQRKFLNSIYLNPDLWNQLTTSDKDLWKTYASNGFIPIRKYQNPSTYSGRNAFLGIRNFISYHNLLQYINFQNYSIRTSYGNTDLIMNSYTILDPPYSSFVPSSNFYIYSNGSTNTFILNWDPYYTTNSSPLLGTGIDFVLDNPYYLTNGDQYYFGCGAYDLGFTVFISEKLQGINSIPKNQFFNIFLSTEHGLNFQYDKSSDNIDRISVIASYRDASLIWGQTGYFLFTLVVHNYIGESRVLDTKYITLT